VGVNFAGINLNQTIGLGTGAIPPDMAMAVGPSQIVQMVNGAYQVYSTTGVAQGSLITDKAFWQNAGISSSVVSAGLSDPRVVYDPSSGRFFASEITTANTGNQILVAVSNSSNPASGWQAFSFTGNPNNASTGTAGFADFDTLGLDKNGVYIGVDNFTQANGGSFTNSTIYTISKSSLLGGSPAVQFNYNLSPGSFGAVPDPAIDYNGTNSAVLTIGPATTQATLITGVSTGSALGTHINGLIGTQPVNMRQPSGQLIDANDNRFSSSPFIVGNLLYGANIVSVTDNLVTHDVVQWLIVNMTTDSLVATGTISDPNFDYTYASVAADANGDFALIFDRSGGVNTPADNISSYADVCHFNSITLSTVCDSTLLLSQGLSGSYSLNAGGDFRWGDYSAISIDPSNPNAFWAAVEVPISSSRWGTQITEIEFVVPEPGALAFSGLGLALLIWRRRRA
jgi:hypothetical protein